jgi:ferredoxin-NADP reductase
MTIKAHAQGRATRWLHERLSLGDMIAARAPRGRFTIASRQTDRIALVSAGSGASPLMAMLRHLADIAADTTSPGCMRRAARPISCFPKNSPTLQRRMPNLKVAMLVSQPGARLVRLLRPAQPAAGLGRSAGFRPARGVLLRPGRLHGRGAS